MPAKAKTDKRRPNVEGHRALRRHAYYAPTWPLVLIEPEEEHPYRNLLGEHCEPFRDRERMMSMGGDAQGIEIDG